jgi:hypothetical protein
MTVVCRSDCCAKVHRRSVIEQGAGQGTATHVFTPRIGTLQITVECGSSPHGIMYLREVRQQDTARICEKNQQKICLQCSLHNITCLPTTATNKIECLLLDIRLQRSQLWVAYQGIVDGVSRSIVLSTTCHRRVVCGVRSPEGEVLLTLPNSPLYTRRLLRRL